MASLINRRVVVTRLYRTTDPILGPQTEIIEKDINLNSTSIFSKSASRVAIIRSPSSPSAEFYPTSEFSHAVKVEPVGSPTSSLFSPLCNEAQQVPSPRLSALTDTVVDTLKMEWVDECPLPADLFEVVSLPASNTSSFFDDELAVFPVQQDHGRVQLDTPQPQVSVGAPQPWSYPTVSSDAHYEQQHYETASTSVNVVNLASLSAEETQRLLAEISDNAIDGQAVVTEQQQQAVEFGLPAQHLLEHDYHVEAEEKEDISALREFFDLDSVDPEIVSGGESTSNDQNGFFDMESTINLEPYIQQISDEDEGEPSYESAAEDVASPSTSRSSNTTSRPTPYSTYRDRRDRNNEASRKSRANRKAKFEEAKKDRVELESRNRSLHTEVARLEAIKNEWKAKLLQIMGTR